MDTTKTEIAAKLRRRAFRSGNARHALKLMHLADEVPHMHLPNGERVLMAMTVEDRRGDTPAQRRLRRKKRWLDMARPLTRHPVLLEGIAELLPRAKGRPGANLREHLLMDDEEIAALRIAIEERFGIRIPQHAVDEWIDLNDVTDSIAGSLNSEAA